MRWRLGLLVVLVLIAVALVWTRIASPHHARKPFTDRGVTMPLNQPGGGTAPAEAYEVYSALYQAPMHEQLVFAEDSETDIPQVNGSCLQPGSSQEKEMTDAFVAANQQSHRWEQKFSIPQGYRLLPHAEIVQAETCRLTGQGGTAQCADYQQVRYVRFLGVPGFSHAHSRALVSVIKSCAPGNCGGGGIFAVEKTRGAWQRSPESDFTRDCSWMY